MKILFNTNNIYNSYSTRVSKLFLIIEEKKLKRVWKIKKALMTLLKGLSISEIAKELDIVPTTVRRTINSYYKL